MRGYDRESAGKTFDQILSKKDNLWGYFMIDKDIDDVVGYSLLTSYWCNEEGGNVIILDELYIAPNNRHKGYAKQFMEWIQTEFADSAVSITLEVLSTNVGAKQLYANEGFYEDGFEVLSKTLIKKPIPTRE